MNRKHIIRNLRKRGIAFDENASTADLQNLLTAQASVVNLTRHFNSGRGKIEVTFNKADETPAEILISEEIGKDPWTGEGISAKDIRETLNEISPKTRPLNFLVNSPGGSVNEGCAIRNILNEWEGKITKTIIGVAASTASWCIPADNVRAYKNSQVFIHRSMGCAFGNVDDFAKAIEYLNTTDGQIAEMLADQSDASNEEMLELMKNETLLTGAQAKELGLVDEIIDGEAKNQFTPEWINAAKQKLAALNNLRANPAPAEGNNNNKKDNTVKRTDKIALLNTWGCKLTDDASLTDARIDELINLGKTGALAALNIKTEPTPAPSPVNVINIDDHPIVKAMNAQLQAQRRKDIQNAVDKAASEGRIPALEIENWVNDAVAAVDGPNGNPVLARLNKLESRQPGIAPIPETINRLDVTNADFKDIRRGFDAHDEPTNALFRGNEVSMKEIQRAAVNKALMFRKFRNRFLEMVNTNTIDAALQRQVILQDIVIRDFKRRVLTCDMFSTVFRNVPLEGTHKVEVPYFDLDSSASQVWDDSTGYATIGNTASAVREIVVGDGTGDGDVGVGHARLYQGLQFTSSEIARQPYLKIAQLAALKAEKLAFDIWQDILSVVTAANFGAAAKTETADAFDSDDIADLKVACKAWPMEGRGLILDSAYDANLLKDPSFKYALNAASDSAIKEGRLYPRVMGFDYVENPNIPSNSENLVGFAFWKYAILVAFAPVPPVEEVRRSGTTWELITDPDSGVSLEYRTFGNNVLDKATYTIESSYGYAKGLETGLKRIVSAA